MARPSAAALWRAAGTQVEARRLQLGLSREQAAHPFGPSPTVWREVERGRGGSVSPRSRTAISRRLGWPDDGLALLGGTGRPVPVLEQDVPVKIGDLIRPFEAMGEQHRRLLKEVADLLAGLPQS